MEVIFLKREVEKKLSYEQAIYISNELKKLHKILLPSVFEESFFDFDSPYKIYYGSRVSAKSYVKAIELLYKAVHQKYFRCLFARETQKDSRDTQFLLFKDIITKMYPWLASEFTIKESSMMIVHNKTGHFLKGASFEDPPRSLADYTDFWVDEPITRKSCISRADLLDMSGTLRNSYGMASQKHLTFNPISDDTFIYTDFFSEKKVFPANITLANYGDNPFCPPEKIKEFEFIKLIDPERYKVDCLGHWGVIKPNTPFFYNYDSQKHEVDSIEINDNLPICLSLDFNVVMSCLMGQVSVHDGYVRKIKEWRNPEANWDIEELIVNIVNKIGLHREYLITGDASGDNRGTFTKGHASGFTIIFSKLTDMGVNFTDMVGTSNMSHYNSKQVNNTLLKVVDDIKYSRTGCPITISDIKKMEQDSAGGYNKKLAEAKGYGHLGDCERYFNHVFCRDLWSDYVVDF